MQTCHYRLTQNQNEWVKKIWIFRKKSLNKYTKTEFYRNSHQIQSKKKKNLNFESGHLNLSKFQGKNLNQADKIWMNGRPVYKENF